MANQITREKHRAHSDSIRKPVIQLDKNTGAVIKKWPGIIDAARGLNIERTNISACANSIDKHNKSVNGFVFVFADEYDPNIDYRVVYSKSIQQNGDKNAITNTTVVEFNSGTIVRAFLSPRSASEFFKCTISAITRRCREGSGLVGNGTRIIKCGLLKYFKDLSEDEKRFVLENAENLIN